MTLQQGQGHQTWNELVDPKQGYDNAKFEKKKKKNSLEKCPWKKNRALSNQETCLLEYMRKSKIVVYS